MSTAAAGITLRRARADDAEGYVAVMNDATVYPGVLQLPYTDAAFWRQRLATEFGGPAANDVHLVALHEGQVIAVGGVHPTGLAVRRRHVGGIGMGVRGDWQGRGVGSLLMTALCEHADRWLALLRLELTVYTDNARAIALYRRHGFEVEGTQRAYALRDGAYVDVLMMARLHPSPPALR